MTGILHRLLPPAAPATAQEILESFGLHVPAVRASAETASKASAETAAQASAETASKAPPETPARPRVLLNMVSTIDGRATIGGRSGPIGGRADRELFHALRTVVDAVMVGAGTARAERYGPLVREDSARELRRGRGLSEQPLACIVSGRLAFGGEDIPLLLDPRTRVAILTSSQANLPAAAGAKRIEAQIEYIRTTRAGRLDLPRALVELHERFAVDTVLCEGGPHLNAQLLMAGLVDEFFLSLAPTLAGDVAAGEALRILAGADLDPPVELELLSVLESESHLFLRYGVRGAPPDPAR